ncbi:MAG TPA: phosphoribosyltransferase family protein [Acidimicrobiia bacterium]|nr:phosphoribosyltransferase family protein [Acidimicrobiia bacterium]
MRSFKDRADAGRTLAGHVAHLIGSHPLVLGIPRGGVVVAAEVCLALDGELGVVIAGKVRAPDNDELAIGAVASDGVALLDELLIHRLGILPADARTAVSDAIVEVVRREKLFGRAPSVDGRTVVVVDDGVATGATLRAALGLIRRGGPELLVCAVPVGPPSIIDLIAHEVDEVVCPVQPDRLWAVAEWYEDFAQVSDETVKGLLGRGGES